MDDKYLVSGAQSLCIADFTSKVRYHHAMAIQETVQNSVAQRRRDHSLTQEELASRVQVTRQTVIAIEKGNYVPSVLLALKIAREFNASVEEVFWYASK
jgi:putative transcriptional regulator